jgi:hypothetical protein
MLQPLRLPLLLRLL